MTTTYTYDNAGRLTRQTRSVGDFTLFGYNQRNQVTSVAVSTEVEPARTFAYSGLGEMVYANDGTATPSYFAWNSGRLLSENYSGSTAFYRWGPTGLAEFFPDPATPEKVSYPSEDGLEDMKKLVSSLGTNEYFVSVAGEREAASETGTGTTIPAQNRLQAGAESGLIRIGTTVEELYVGAGGLVYMPRVGLAFGGGLIQPRKYFLDPTFPEHTTDNPPLIDAGVPTTVLDPTKPCTVLSIEITRSPGDKSEAGTDGVPLDYAFGFYVTIRLKPGSDWNKCAYVQRVRGYEHRTFHEYTFHKEDCRSRYIGRPSRETDSIEDPDFYRDQGRVHKEDDEGYDVDGDFNTNYPSSLNPRGLLHVSDNVIVQWHDLPSGRLRWDSYLSYDFKIVAAPGEDGKPVIHKFNMFCQNQKSTLFKGLGKSGLMTGCSLRDNEALTVPPQVVGPLPKEWAEPDRAKAF